MLMPAIFASTVLVFADVIDDFVIVRYLSGDSSTEPVSVKIYNTARAAPTPALNALATMLLPSPSWRSFWASSSTGSSPAVSESRGIESSPARPDRLASLTGG